MTEMASDEKLAELTRILATWGLTEAEQAVVRGEGKHLPARLKWVKRIDTAFRLVPRGGMDMAGWLTEYDKWIDARPIDVIAEKGLKGLEEMEGFLKFKMGVVIDRCKATWF